MFPKVLVLVSQLPNYLREQQRSPKSAKTYLQRQRLQNFHILQMCDDMLIKRYTVCSEAHTVSRNSHNTMDLA